MAQEKNGLVDNQIISVYRNALDYLAKTGFDFVQKPSNVMKLDLSNLEDLFAGLGEGALELSVPYTFGKEILSKTFMEVYGLKKEIDLVRYLRVISILLTNFIGPEKDDRLERHVNLLRRKLKVHYPGYQEDAVIKALHIFEQSLGKRAQCHKAISKSDYQAFARILNAKFNLYNSEEKKGLAIIFLQDIHKKLLKLIQKEQTRALLFERFRYYKIMDIKSEEELLQLANDIQARAELIKKVNNWVNKQHKDRIEIFKQSFKMHYCYLTDEKLLEMIKHPVYSDSLLANLNEFGITEIKSKDDLRKYEQNPKSRMALLKKIKDYCEKEFQMKFA